MLNKISQAVRKNTIYTFIAIFLVSLIIPLVSLVPVDASERLTPGYYGLSIVDNEVQIGEDDVNIEWIHAGLMRITFNTVASTERDDKALLAIPYNDGNFDLDDERKDSEDSREFTIQNWATCHGEVEWDEPDDHTQSVTNLRLDIDWLPSGNAGSCIGTAGNKVDVDADNPLMSKAYFRWIDSGAIERVDGENWGRFIQSETNEFLYARETENGETCQDRIVVSTDKSNSWLYELGGRGFDGTGAISEHDAELADCKFRDSMVDGGVNHNRVPISNVAFPMADIELADNDPGTGTAGSIGAGGEVDPTCETGGNPLSWIVCPILNGILRGIDAIFSNFIDPFLRVSPIQAEDGNIIYDIWKNFRTLGNIVLIFALLFAVFGQTIGGGIVDAYTIKKIMPRILVAAILINLSIYIVALIIDLGNVLGRGIGQIITAPITANGGEAIFNFQLGGLTTTILGGGIIIALIGSAPAFLTGLGNAADLVTPAAGSSGGQAALAVASGAKTLLIMALVVLLPVILVVLAIFLTLIFRQAIIVLLALVSPVALAMWAIPGADKYSKMWLENFIKAVMIYPIVSAIFAISNVLAFIFLNVDGNIRTSTGRSAIADLAAIIVFIAPMAMIPFSFKFAGNILGGVSNFISGSRGKVRTMIEGDRHNPHSRYYNRRKDENGNPLTGFAGVVGGAAGKRWASNKEKVARQGYRWGRGDRSSDPTVESGTGTTSSSSTSADPSAAAGTGAGPGTGPGSGGPSTSTGTATDPTATAGTGAGPGASPTASAPSGTTTTATSSGRRTTIPWSGAATGAAAGSAASSGGSSRRSTTIPKSSSGSTDSSTETSSPTAGSRTIPKAGEKPSASDSSGTGRRSTTIPKAGEPPRSTPTDAGDASGTPTEPEPSRVRPSTTWSGTAETTDDTPVVPDMNIGLDGPSSGSTPAPGDEVVPDSSATPDEPSRTE